MIPIVDRAHTESISPIWRMPFRPFFWGAALWSMIALLVWQLQLSGWQLPALRGGVVWHSHEMLFGFAAAVVVGFLATAMQTWTGIPSPKGPQLMSLVGLWLLARLGYLFAVVPVWIPVCTEVAFFLLAGFLLGARVLRTRQWRNLFVLPAMLAFAGLSACHWLLPGAQSRVALLALLLVTAIILVIGGRVIPFFTARRFQMPPREKLPFAEWGTHIAAILLLLSVALGLPRTLWAALALVLGVLQLVRILRWHPTRIWAEPMVWSLHLSYWLVVLGCFLAALAWSGIAPSWHSPALHAFAVGGIGGLILSMASRVSLGHTGRVLKAPRLMPLAFAALACSALVRVFWASAPTGFLVAIVTWIVGYALFLLYYTPVLFRPRPDGHPG
ncbi:NnrS family protein [Microbulbifer spongiae]|uniref:NnrS family protein n=1 Tax=Microbulbifer spongiae TaxID=2944933 RepID=A0ABY9E970_9GAMM|nr:NnrS family protein [Microbulbifer sp. MI-G]WKD48872.1 NnrS family protein [Microbulbifer sp. MI-G]